MLNNHQRQANNLATTQKTRSAGWLRKIQTGCTAMLLATAASANNELDIAQNPLFTGINIDPNLMFVIDDSGSMHWETMPDPGVTYKIDEEIGDPGEGGLESHLVMWLYPRVDGLHGDGDYGNDRIPKFEGDLSAFMRSAENNTIYYNPAITYRPWVDPDGNVMADAPPDAAPNRPRFDGSVPENADFGTRNLEREFSHDRWRNDDGSDGDEIIDDIWPAVYYQYDGVGDVDSEASYQRVEIRSTNAPFTGHGRANRTDCAAGDTCAYAEEIQNFANWYSYHRNRIFASRAGIGRSFADLDEGMRVGFGSINHRRETTNTLDGQSGNWAVVRGVRDFTGADRIDFFERLYDRPVPSDGTALRRGLDGAGQYFSRTDDRGPWSTTPGEAGGEDLACRQSFTVLMTDGFATGGNDWAARHTDRRQNIDGTTSQNTTNIHPDDESLNYSYSPADPYQSDHGNTLADVAMYYWKRDLRPDILNRVPTAEDNEAFWQHMVTYGIGLGVEGSIKSDDVWQAVQDGTAIDWPDPRYNHVNCGNGPAGTCEARIDDLLHAAANSRGGFFSVADPESFREELGAVLLSIADRAQATTSVSVASTRIETDSLVYAAEFDSEDWSGNIIARDPFGDNEIQWEASNTLDNPSVDQRRSNTYTYNPVQEQGEAFDGAYVNLFYEQELLLDFPDPAERQDHIDKLIDYLLGDHSNEEQNNDDGSFRDRSTALGDIVNSQLTFSGPRDEGWVRLGADSQAAERYPEFVEGKEDRGVLFVGANDGMLHAFDADDGSPLFSYVPSQGLAGLIDYASPDYAHRFFVDGQIAVADAWDGNNWRTILVGAYGAGGRGAFALDVTDPTSFSASDVLWEVGPDDGDVGEYIGHVYGSPTITRLPGGQFVTVFGNGYNSEANEAALIVLDAFSGDPVDDGAFPVNINPDPDTNGLASPGLWMETGPSRFVERAYAGDLTGRMWRFDFSGDEDGGLSGIALSGEYNDGMLFHAKKGQGNNVVNQPITSNPTLAASALGGLNVLFGTGKFIENSDRLIEGSPRMETFYALLDRNESVSDSDLGEVVLADAENEDSPDARSATIESEGPKGWRMDLAVGGAEGERVLARPDVVFGTVIFSSFQPIEDPCQGGGIPRIYVQSLSTGAGALDGCPGCAGAPIGESGAPTAPPTVISPPSPPVDPGDPDPGFPGPPGDDDDQPVPPVPDDDEFGDRQRWCSDFGYISPNTQRFVRLGSLCDGRQIWREVR